MRNLKKLLAVILTVVMIASMMVPALAANTYEAEALKLQSIGMFAGEPADLKLEEGVTRIQGLAFAIRAAGVEADAFAMTDEEVATILDTYVDGADVPEWGRKYAAYAIKNGITVGVSATEKKFAALDPISGTSFLVFLMKAGMGYADVTTATVVEASVEAGILTAGQAAQFGAKAALIRDDAAGILYGAAMNGVNADGTPLIEALIASGFVDRDAALEAGFVEEVVPEELEVVSVEALNLRELVITFNKAVSNVDEAKKKENYKINGNAVDKVELSDDNETVTITTTNANKMGNYATDGKLVIAKAVGFDADVKISAIASKDNVVPSLVSVEAKGPRNLKLTFSEPLDETVSSSDSIAAFKLDKQAVALDSTSATYSGRVLNIKTLSDLKEGEHSLEVSNKNLKDSAGFVVEKSTVTFTYTKDTSPLAIEVVESTETSVKIKFNKPVKDFKTNSNVKITHTYNTDTNSILANAGGVTSSDDQEFEITFGATKPFPPGSTTVYIKYVSSSGTKIKDNYGNALEETSFTVTTAADVEKPVVDSIEFKDANKLQVKFSENVENSSGTNGALNALNYTLKNSDGDRINITSVTFDGTSKKIVNLATAQMNGGTYTLEIKNIKDVSVAKNKMDTVTLTFDATDKIAPTVVDKDTGNGGIQIFKSAAKKFRIDFSEAMDPETVTDKGNFKYDGKKLEDDDTIELINSNKSIVITIDAGVTTGKEVKMSRVKDAAGNWIEAFETEMTIIATTNNVAPVSDGVKAIADNQVELKFNDIITGATNTDFEVSTNNGGAWKPVTGISITVEGTKTYITLTIADGDKITATDVSGDNAVLVRSVSSAGVQGVTANAEDSYGSKLNFTNAAAQDFVAPKFAAGNYVKALDSNGNGKLDRIDVTFSEALYAGSVQISDFTVEGYEILKAEVNSATVELKIKEKDYNDTGITPKVTLVGEVEDNKDKERNILGAQDGKDAADVAKPVVVSAQFTNATTLVIVYSEAVTSVIDDYTAGAVTNGGAGTATTFTISAIAGSGTNTITLTVAGDVPLVTGDTAVIAIAATVADTADTPNTITAIAAQAISAF